MKKVLFLAQLIITVIVMSCCKPKQNIDLLVVNATIYTPAKQQHNIDAIAINEGKIIEIASSEKLKSKYISSKIVDADSKYIYPGFIDAHCHIYGYALSLRQADLKNTSSFEEVLNKIQAHHKKYPDSKWITGRGWDQNNWEIKEFPSKEKLDEMFPNNPVVLVRIDGHAALINQKAIELAGFSNKTVIKGGALLKKSGELTGVVLDKACDSIKNCISSPSNAELKQLLIKAQNDCFKVGLTTVADAGLDFDIVNLIDSLQQSNQLKIKVYAMLNPSNENFEYYIKKGTYKTNKLHIQSIKLYADGALGSRGAALLEPYSDDKNNLGLFIEPIEYYKDIAEKAIEYGYQLNTHAIGDSAVRAILNVYSSVLKEENDLRWRIEHSQVVHPNDIHKYGKFSIIPAINTTHATSDMNWASLRLGNDRIKSAYAYKNLLQQNGWLCNGSDFPIENINPIFGFYAGFSRKDLTGNPSEGFFIENALTREESLKSMTIWAAKACFEEDEVGSIEVGKDADLVLLDKDIMEAQEIDVPKTKVLKTIVQGEVVYNWEIE